MKDELLFHHDMGVGRAYFKARPFNYPDRVIKTEVEGGEQKTDVRFAIRVDEPTIIFESGYVTEIDLDGGFYRGGDLDGAYLFNTADDAAKAIARRNAHLGAPRQYAIIPVTLTTTTAKYQVTTTETAAKTVYRVKAAKTGLFVQEVDAGFSIIGATPTDFPSANAAAEAIHRRNAKWPSYQKEYHIVPVTTKGETKSEREQIAPASTTRSL